MKIPAEYQVLLGSFIAGLVILLAKFIIDYRKETKGESQKLAVVSIIIGLLIFIPFVGIVGLILGIISVRIKKFKGLSKIGIVINCIALLPWLAVSIFGQ